MPHVSPPIDSVFGYNLLVLWHSRSFGGRPFLGQCSHYCHDERQLVCKVGQLGCCWLGRTLAGQESLGEYLYCWTYFPESRIDVVAKVLFAIEYRQDLGQQKTMGRDGAGT